MSKPEETSASHEARFDPAAQPTRGVQGHPDAGDPVTQAEHEREMLRDRLEQIRRQGELGQENARVRRQLNEINEVIGAVTQWPGPDRPTQEAIANQLGIPVRRLQERLEPYPGLWQALTAARE